MTSATIPAEIRRFVLASLASVPHLEALLLLYEHQQQPWTVAQVAGRLYVSEAAARTLLDDLHASQLLTRSDGEPIVFSFSASGEIGAVVERLDRFYPRNVVAVTQLIHSNDARRAQQLADAFKFRRET